MNGLLASLVLLGHLLTFEVEVAVPKCTMSELVQELLETVSNNI